MLKKTSVALLVLTCLSFSLVGCAASGSNIGPDKNYVAPQAEKSWYIVPNVEGMSRDEAIEALEKVGFEAEFIGGEGSTPEGVSWYVSKQSIKFAATAPAGTVVKLTLVEREEPRVVVTPSGLRTGTASTECLLRGIEQFPDGFKVRWDRGESNEIVEGDTMVVRYSVDATDAFGTVTEGTLHCVVAGTDDAPEITSFQFGTTF